MAWAGFFLRVLGYAFAFAGIFWVARNGMRRWMALLPLPEAVQVRYRRYEAWPYGIFVLTLSGAFGIQLILPVMLGLIVLWLLAQALLLLGILIAEKRGAFFYSFGWLLFLFLISGCAALIYQVVWQRALFTAFGVNIESVTAIVSVFMFGLGIGALAGGWLSVRFSGQLPQVFMLCELLIGAFGIVSLPLIHVVGTAAQGYGLAAVFLATFALLCLPTMLMGATLPILVAFLYAHLKHIGKTVGLLYFANTLGSAVACFATVDVLFAFWGLQAAVWVAAGLNLSVGLLVFAFARGIAREGGRA